MNAEEFKTGAIGDAISYLLVADQQPGTPQRAYRGLWLACILLSDGACDAPG